MNETCDECSFDASRWSDRDALGSLPVIAPIWRMTIDGMDPALLQVRPEPAVWSIGEYADHTRETLFGMRFLLDTALEDPGSDLGASPAIVPSAEPARIDVDRTIDRIDEEATALMSAMRIVRQTDSWGSTVIVDGDEVDPRWILRHALHDSFHHLRDAGRIRQRVGAGSPPQTGSVVRLHRSDGGVPKTAIEEAEVGWSGVEGDVQNDRKHHGRPFQALCLWSADVIDRLRAEGHPIAPGLAGENVTISGVEWASLRPGTVVAIGEVLVEVSAYSIPCAKNSGWFVDGDFRRMSHEEHPGWSRLYAWVRRPGRIRVGDTVTVEP